jgi:hypothetical protein
VKLLLWEHHSENRKEPIFMLSSETREQFYGRAEHVAKSLALEEPPLENPVFLYALSREGRESLRRSLSGEYLRLLLTETPLTPRQAAEGIVGALMVRVPSELRDALRWPMFLWVALGWLLSLGVGLTVGLPKTPQPPLEENLQQTAYDHISAISLLLLLIAWSVWRSYAEIFQRKNLRSVKAHRNSWKALRGILGAVSRKQNADIVFIAIFLIFMIFFSGLFALAVLSYSAFSFSLYFFGPACHPDIPFILSTLWGAGAAIVAGSDFCYGASQGANNRLNPFALLTRCLEEIADPESDAPRWRPPAVQPA